MSSASIEYRGSPGDLSVSPFSIRKGFVSVASVHSKVRWFRGGAAAAIAKALARDQLHVRHDPTKRP